MICLFEKDETVFNWNGLAVLKPSVCTVSETAGGGYTLHLEHPMDETGIYDLLQDERIIRAPVPPMHIPAFTLPETVIWQTTAATSLWSAVPYYRRTVIAEDIKKVKQAPNYYAWKSFTVYNTGELVTFSGGIYRAKQYNYQIPPTGSSGSEANWKYETTVAGSGDEIDYSAGTKIEDLASGVNLSKIADYYSDYIQARAPSGHVGYVAKADCEETTTTESGQTIDAFDITEQLFRICKIQYSDDQQTVIVDAKHISYDFNGNALRVCKIADAEPMTAIAILRGSLLDEDNRTIVTNIDGQKVTADWSFLNPCNAILDPDKGLVMQLGAALIRDNGSFYLLDNSNPRNGIRLAYGKNLVGVSWSQSSEDVVTRVMPRCGDGNDGILYLDDLYVESEHSTDYAVQRTEPMNCGYAVGDTIEKADGTEITLDASSAKAQMEEDARKRFEVDKADALLIELEVHFLMLGDTIEYQQYKGMESLCLYDMIEVVTGKSRATATAQVTEYEYDSILERYNYIKAGDVRTLAKTLPGYRMKNGSISYDKLANDVIDRIRNAQ